MTYWLKRAVLLFCALMLLPGLPIRAWALQILYPADGSYVTKSNYLVVAGGEERLLDGIMIDIDGVRSEIIDLTPQAYRALYADKLVVEPMFDPGENTIVVEGYRQGEKVATAKASVYFLADMYKAPPPNYRKEVFHLPEREAFCVDCHNMQPTAVQTSPENNPCASCHARMLNQAHVHGPAGVYQCENCHDLDSRPQKYQISLDDQQLCSKCHDGWDVTDMPMLHGPVAAGMCLICHDPHASNQYGQLVTKVNALCLSCHAEVEGKPHVTNINVSGRHHPISGDVNLRNPEGPLNCASCHNPHGGKTSKYFVGGITSPMQLCAECHKK